LKKAGQPDRNSKDLEEEQVIFYILFSNVFYPVLPWNVQIYRRTAASGII